MQKAPADVGMGSKGMTGPRRHDAGIAQELPAQVFERPPAEAVPFEAAT
jgi:hypothetical protein